MYEVRRIENILRYLCKRREIGRLLVKIGKGVGNVFPKYIPAIVLWEFQAENLQRHQSTLRAMHCRRQRLGLRCVNYWYLGVSRRKSDGCDAAVATAAAESELEYSLLSSSGLQPEKYGQQSLRAAQLTPRIAHALDCFVSYLSRFNNKPVLIVFCRWIFGQFWTQNTLIIAICIECLNHNFLIFSYKSA